MFTVDELHKDPPSRRAIYWTDILNDLLTNVPTPALDDVVRAVLQARGGQWAV